MFNKFINNLNPQSLASRMRQTRLAFFYSLLPDLDSKVHILDVGGSEYIWRSTKLPEGKDIEITLLNLNKIPTSSSRYVSIAGDAKDIQFPDSHFDVVFSNSVIEHMGSFEDQQKMARECMRVGRRYFIQTPNKYFPIEPHFLFPMYQFLPNIIQVWLIQNFKLGWINKTPNKIEAIKLIASIRLLDRTKFEMLFPGSNIFEEKFLGLTKSFVAYGGWEIN